MSTVHSCWLHLQERERERADKVSFVYDVDMSPFTKQLACRHNGHELRVCKYTACRNFMKFNVCHWHELPASEIECPKATSNFLPNRTQRVRVLWKLCLIYATFLVAFLRAVYLALFYALSILTTFVVVSRRIHTLKYLQMIPNYIPFCLIQILPTLNSIV